MPDRHGDEDLRDRSLDNQVRGRAEQASGHIKDAVGGLTDDSSLQAEGKLDKMKGRSREKIGDIQRDVARESERLGRETSREGRRTGDPDTADDLDER